MPRTRSLAWAELKIGLMSVFAVVMASLLIFFLAAPTGFFWQRYSIKTVIANGAGVREGSPVRLAGVEVGTVSKMDFIGDHVEVLMVVSKDSQSRITDTSVASIGSVSLLGDSAIDITASSAGTPIPAWGYVRAAPSRGRIGDVTEQASASLEQVNGLVKDMREGRGTLGRLVADDALYDEMTRLVSAAEEVASNINNGRGTLGRLASNPAAAKSLEASMENLQMMTARIRGGEGTLGRLLQDDALARSLTSTSGNLDAVTARINRGEGTAGKLVNDDQLYTRLNSMADRLDRVMVSLQQGEGTAGRLLQDKQLYENMNGTMMEIRNLVANINKDPKKYLTMKVSLF
ncbi:MAG TPA: MlaD family protein [Vicinamibacterales bacterium]|jgi:phospholipid/cholesterol/gamma-HCH transport system substrate-binding protein